jgi:hypothetical protein
MHKTGRYAPTPPTRLSSTPRVCAHSAASKQLHDERGESTREDLPAVLLILVKPVRTQYLEYITGIDEHLLTSNQTLQQFHCINIQGSDSKRSNRNRG